MQYLLLIYHDEGKWEKLPEPEKQKLYEGYKELRLDLEAKEKFKGSNRLQPTSAATTVRLRNGKTSVTDGPFLLKPKSNWQVTFWWRPKTRIRFGHCRAYSVSENGVD